MGIPTNKGIDQYVKVEQVKIVSELQLFLKDTIYDYYISTDDLSTYTDYDSFELGRTYYPDEIVINNQPKFKDYDINLISNFKRKLLNEDDRFCKGVIIHELSHVYCNQVLLEMIINHKPVSPEYHNIKTIPLPRDLGAEFIEEGICEYAEQKMNESAPYNDNYAPTSIAEILDYNNRSDVMYKYGYFYVKRFLDYSIEHYGSIKPGLIEIFGNKPPSFQEIIDPVQYFSRLKL